MAWKTGHGLDEYSRRLDELPRTVHVTLEERDARMRRIAWEETQAQLAYERRRARTRGRP